MRTARAALLATVLLALAGCGGGGSDTTIPGLSGPAGVPGGADPADVKVIDAWVTTLRRGDVEGAAGYFAIPSRAANPPAVIRIESLHDAVVFNESLPCGARLVRAVDTGRGTTATFRLTERPGPGVCGPGTGTLAKTAFVIEDGKIAEWRRRLGGARGGGGAPGQSV
jgi:limonene-1,2-epoxide hydrolase